MNLHTKDEIRALLRRLDGEPADAIESEILDCNEWSAETKRKLRETVVCFANRAGGVIVLGVADRKRTRVDALVGVPDDVDPSELQKSIYDGTAPNIHVEIQELLEPEGRLLLVHVPPGRPPYMTTEGMGKIRVGKECKALTGTHLASLFPLGGPEPSVAGRKRIVSLAVGLLRALSGELFRTSDGAMSALPGTLWFGKNRDWVRVVERLGTIERVRGRFSPYVEPAHFDGSDDAIVAAAQVVLELYAWSSDNNPDFEAIRTAFGLPQAADVKGLLGSATTQAASDSPSLSLRFDPTDPLCVSTEGGDETFRVQVVNEGKTRAREVSVALEAIEPTKPTLLLRRFTVMKKSDIEVFEVPPLGRAGTYVDILFQRQHATYGFTQALRLRGGAGWLSHDLEQPKLVLRLEADERTDLFELTFRRDQHRRMRPVLGE